MKPQTIGIIDYDMGNLLSVYHAFDSLGANVTICRDPQDVQSVDRVVLPGVGAFRDCMANLHRRGFIDALNESVLLEKKPFLGICLGMQATARRSFEGGDFLGLNWLAGEVVRLCPDDSSLRVPQIGWNEVHFDRADPLFARIPVGADFYFVHSFQMVCDDPKTVAATCDHGGPVTAAVRSGNIFATQFHPEKSQSHGLQLLDNFLEWQPEIAVDQATAGSQSLPKKVA